MKINNLKMISSLVEGSYHSIIFQSFIYRLKYKNKKYVNRSGSSYMYWINKLGYVKIKYGCFY